MLFRTSILVIVRRCFLVVSRSAPELMTNLRSVSDYGSDGDDVDGIPNDYIGDDQLDEGLGESDARSYYNEDPGKRATAGFSNSVGKDADIHS